jgi:hypothetical protein
MDYADSVGRNSAGKNCRLKLREVLARLKRRTLRANELDIIEIKYMVILLFELLHIKFHALF